MLLKGVRVLDLSHTLAGPFATMVLADLGAEVIKVEPIHGDETRSWTPIVEGESAYFLSINRGKKSIAINLKHPKGREIVYRLATISDVLIENFRPGVPEKLGVDYKTIVRYNPKIVYCSIKGFKQGSIYESLPAYDLILQGLSGLMMSTGTENDPPIRVAFALFDVITGLLATTYILAALFANARPIHIEIPMYDTAIFSMCYIPMIYLLTKRTPKRMGSAHPSIVPYQAFRDSQGKWFIVAAANDRLWRQLCKALKIEYLAEDKEFKTNPDRVKNRDKLIELLQRIFLEKPRDYWIKILREYGVPAAPVYELDEVFSDPYVVSQNIVVFQNHKKLGRIPQLAQPGYFNGKRLMTSKAPPTLGEDSYDILRNIGYSDKDIENFKKEGVIL